MNLDLDPRLVTYLLCVFEQVSQPSSLFFLIRKM